MWLHASCHLEFNVSATTSFLFMLRPRSGDQQWIGREEFFMSQGATAKEFSDSFGNLTQRVSVPSGEFSLISSVYAEVADASDAEPGAPFVDIEELPDEVVQYLFPSRYCESDRFSGQASEIVGNATPGYDQCAAIVDYIRKTIRYAPELGGDIISACEVNQRSEAVCRDMAQLGMACCRALSIPARLVVGYLETLKPVDLHAWFEAYVGGRWYTFDPTQENLDGGRLAIAYGRDAADVAVYTQFGNSVDLLSMEVEVEKIDTPSA
ncbi:transglutaminase family protein [Verrucomicrobiales bacterium BCK34]|nr:transglutaminase family protein [Verrucomicrobiales bacterium BCK34]